MRENFALSGMIIDNQDAQIGQIVLLRRPARPAVSPAGP